MNLYVVTLGCPKNRVDTEHILGNLNARLPYFNIVSSPEKADTIIINTCSFIEEAVNESIETILEIASQATRQEIVVTGCLVERYGAETLKKEIPEADHFIGFEAKEKLPQILGYDPLVQGGARLLSTPPWRAYLKIAEGCSNRCTYCLIPKIRGKQICRDPQDILGEAVGLIESGVKEITLVAQDLTAYEFEGFHLADLLEKIAAISQDVWIRLLYLYPSKIDSELLTVMKNHQNICPYFDLPIQHASSKILKKMGRKYDKKEMCTVINQIRSKIPESYIRTSLIVGFPGETEEDFEELKSFVLQARFDHLGCFTYSDEQEAPSFRFVDKVDPNVAKRRRNEIMALQQQISIEKLARLVGTVQQVLVEGLSDETDLLLVGRTKYQAPEIDGLVYINEGFANKGDMVNVEITDSHVYDLVGKIVQNRQ